MARSVGTAVENTFINGLVTEATALNFPEGAVTSSTNIVYNEDGSAESRKGIDYEVEYTLNTVQRDGSAIVEFLWSSVASRGDITFVVQQIGETLYFYRVDDTEVLSSSLHATTIDLGSFLVSGAPAISAIPCSFSSGKGYLFVTHKYCEPFYVSYNPDANTFTATQINVEIRDFEGLDDGYDPDEHPASLTEAHEYNLLNQGWDYTAEYDGGGGATDNVIDRYFTVVAAYPSNAQQWTDYKNSSTQFRAADADKYQPGNSLAPKGHFIYSAWASTRSDHARITSVTEWSSSYFRPSCCAFAFGRVFYAGVEAAGYGSNIYFSQIIESDEQLGFCYQKQDPVSEFLSDLLPSDGGVIRILEIGTVYRLYPADKAILVFASNGIWAIAGTDTSPFSASDYTITRLSSNGVLSASPIVDVQGSPAFWNETGIWAIVYDGTSYKVESLSDKKVKSYLTAVPLSSITESKGYYDHKSKIIQWLYRSTASASVDQKYEYDRILNFNTTTGAFYPFSFSSTTKTINGLISLESPDWSDPELVTTGAGTVTASGGDVYSYTVVDLTAFRYFVTKETATANTYDSTWAIINNEDYIDWEADAESVAYTKEFFSGYKLAGEGNKKFQSNYIVVYTENLTNSSAFLQGCWDFTNSASSSKWSSAQQVYYASPDYRDYRMRKLKIRGWGRGLQFRIYGESGKPFKIVGWSVFVSGNQQP